MSGPEGIDKGREAEVRQPVAPDLHTDAQLKAKDAVHGILSQVSEGTERKQKIEKQITDSLAQGADFSRLVGRFLSQGNEEDWSYAKEAILARQNELLKIQDGSPQWRNLSTGERSWRWEMEKQFQKHGIATRPPESDPNYMESELSKVMEENFREVFKELRISTYGLSPDQLSDDYKRTIDEYLAKQGDSKIKKGNNLFGIYNGDIVRLMRKKLGNIPKKPELPPLPYYGGEEEMEE